MKLTVHSSAFSALRSFIGEVVREYASQRLADYQAELEKVSATYQARREDLAAEELKLAREWYHETNIKNPDARRAKAEADAYEYVGRSRAKLERWRAQESSRLSEKYAGERTLAKMHESMSWQVEVADIARALESITVTIGAELTESEKRAQGYGMTATTHGEAVKAAKEADKRHAEEARAEMEATIAANMESIHAELEREKAEQERLRNEPKERQRRLEEKLAGLRAQLQGVTA